MLQYTHITLVHMQVIYLPDNHKLPQIENLDKSNQFQYDLFYGASSKQGLMRRYSLPGFNYAFTMGHNSYDSVEIKGLMNVDATVYFNKFAVVRYYMRIDPYNLTRYLTTDHVIELASLGIKKDCSDLIDSCEYSDLADFLSDNLQRTAKTLDEIKNSYRMFLTGGIETGIHDTNYVFIDVSQDLEDSEGLFKGMEANEKIDYINKNMMSELYGLLRLTPIEWVFGRTDKQNTSTGNISLDTDDLVILNENVCVSFWAYSTKNNLVDWGSFTYSTESYYVSWPELYLILESVLVKRYSLMVTNEIFRLQTSFMLDKSGVIKNDAVEISLKKNAVVRLNLANVFLQLDNMKLADHKTLSEDISRKFGLEQQMQTLETKMKYTDEALELFSNSRRLRQATNLNIVMAVLASVSALGLLFNQIRSPFIQRVFSISDSGTETVGLVIIAFAIICMLTCLLLILRNKK